MTPAIRPTRPLAMLAAGVLALTVAACGGDDDSAADAGDDGAPTSEPTTDTSAETAGGSDAEGTVEIERSRYAPLEIEIAAGDEVTWVNLDPYAHTVTSKDDSPIAYDSGVFGQDETFAQTFDEPGTYAYFCEIHPTMRATVVVS